MLKKKSAEDIVIDTITYSILAIIMFATLYPFYYVLIVSFNEGTDSMLGGMYALPRKFTLENYRSFLSDSAWYSAFGITVARTVVGSLLSVIVTALVAYGLSQKQLLFKQTYFTIVIIAMYFSGGLIPYYVVLRSLNLLNTFAVYVVPSMLSTFFLLIAVSFFREIPPELKESAHIDGANDLRVFFQIVLPVSKPLLATMALFAGVGQWNSWLDSAYFVQNDALRTLTFRMMETINKSQIPTDAVAYATGASNVTGYSLQVTAMVVSIIPIVCVYPFLQKHFVGGMMLGSVKE
ncbi:carbohydrate ABC transporter permease [Paenibacillaceae bacterium]|nr:carbohydrate ABC transporter permease [Paenibacillaceae bacterium]